MAAQPSARPLYAVFLERVIQIEAVQRHRAAVTDDGRAQFFSEGRPYQREGDFRWSLNTPKALPWSWQAGAPAPVSLPMQHALNAAAAAFEEFIKALKNGDLIASGVHPATGARYDLDRAEWTRSDLILDVRNGDLIQVEVQVEVNYWFDLRFGKKTVRWTAITLVEAIPEQKLGKIDWDDWWKHETARREQGSLPNEKDYSRQTVPLIIERYGVTSVDGADLRRFKVALYRGDLERPKRTRPKHEG